jgi:5-methylcytosine-specific restriction endonuclease McrBC GTP-binding regulatory subunit McrB
VPFEPEKITREHVFQAVENIKSKKINIRPSTTYDVLIDGEKYPPKEILRYAHQEMNGELPRGEGGGEPTNRWLKKLGFEIYNKVDSNNPVPDLIKRYKEYVKESQLKDELYKWRLIKTFNGRPNTEAVDFTKEITSINFGNLIYPVGLTVIHQMATHRPEEFRNAFKYLFDEEIELSNRVAYFNQETLRIYRDIEPENKLSHHQDERTIATYLAFHDSSKYAFYKDSFYQKYCNLIGIKPEKSGKKLVHYLSLIEDFIEKYVEEDSELLALKKQFLTDDCYEDANHKIFAQDILYSTLDLQKGLGKSYWRVGTSEGELNFWDSMHANKCISIGWSEIGDLREQNIQNKKDIIQLLENLDYYPEDKNVLSRKAGEIFNFYNDIQPGDIILAQDGSNVLGIGEVVEEYDYDSSQKFSHTLPVNWKVVDTTLKNTEGLRTTVYKITQPDIIHQIENLLKESKQGQNMNNEVNQILYGPPGTGKTYNTINTALELCGKTITGLNRDAIKSLYEIMVNEGRIVFTTFHQSMTYEDFVEGIKPIEPERVGDPVIYRVVEGIFRKLCIEAAFSIAREGDSISTENVLDFSLSYDDFVQDIEEKLAAGETLELATKNGGKVLVDGVSEQGNIAIKHIGGTRTYTVSKSRLTKLQSGIESLDGVNNINDEFRAIIGGSNSSAYWAVLNAIMNRKPVLNGINKTDRKYTWEEKVEVVKALKKEDYKGKNGEPYVLIIDEINRGNVSQIFGELITLIEEDKRLGKPESLQVQLPYSKEWFGVPPNVHIVGTMNTADRSVEALDTALRRRFSFTEMPPKSHLINKVGKAENGIISGIVLSSLLDTINKRIEKLLDKDHMIGHSYFLSVKNLEELKASFQNKIIPLLQEYFFGDYGKIGLVIGSEFFRLEKDQMDKDFFAPFDDYDSSPLLERNVYHLKNIKEMDDAEFIQAINNLSINSK